jgi:hypothetical protein
MNKIVALAATVLLFPLAALAQAPPGVARGVIVTVGNDTLTLKLADGSKMTNGTVGKVTAAGTGRQLQVSYPNGERQITVPPNVPVVQITPGERSLAKPGTAAFLIVIKSPSGALSSSGVAVGENGAIPPM